MKIPKRIDISIELKSAEDCMFKEKQKGPSQKEKEELSKVFSGSTY